MDLMTEFQQDAFLACFSETTIPAVFQYSVTQVKDKLLEAGGFQYSENMVCSDKTSLYLIIIALKC